MISALQEPSSFLKQLGEIVRTVVDAEVTPRFGHLGTHDVTRKAAEDAPEDIVTKADHAAEDALCQALPSLVPASRVIGEEAVSADPQLLTCLQGEAPTWVVDPLDGTRNFAAGHGPFGTMVALVERGTVLASAIYLPLQAQLFLAGRGAGAYLNGNRLTQDPNTRERLLGTAQDRFMPPPVAQHLAERTSHYELLPGCNCAAHEYTQVASGKKDFAMYYRLLPWDHLPGALILREASGIVRGMDGRDYDVFDEPRVMLLARNGPVWDAVHHELTKHG
jgi:fructose-1,6-bisphosphatase/inositol monophosphatase family enzyme